MEAFDPTALLTLEELCDELDYQSVTFHATGPDGTPVYHTNVVLAVGCRCAVVSSRPQSPVSSKPFCAPAEA